mgnify:CR=1 FL=1
MKIMIGCDHGGFELKEGAFATTISHDSHNIIAVGCSDKDILEAINAVILEINV